MQRVTSFYTLLRLPPPARIFFAQIKKTSVELEGIGLLLGMKFCIETFLRIFFSSYALSRILDNAVQSQDRNIFHKSLAQDGQLRRGWTSKQVHSRATSRTTWIMIISVFRCVHFYGWGMPPVSCFAPFLSFQKQKIRMGDAPNWEVKYGFFFISLGRILVRMHDGAWRSTMKLYNSVWDWHEKKVHPTYRDYIYSFERGPLTRGIYLY